MIDTEMTSAEQDEAAVAAVKRGDVERYRELVERHERRVFAVAWSCLGDAALAEEVTQEAFIRGYRRLWMIGDGAKFAGWMSTIARRLAINFGLRRRNELSRRERWALENYEPVGDEHSPGESGSPHTPETLRQTLAQLPAAHRECLVLFYLEGKSGAEAAAALGISESALRVRLHRARVAIRERLEAQLEGSLAKLGPVKTLIPAIMAGVLASTSAKAAGGAGTVGLGAKFFSVAGKSFLCSWFVALISLVTVLPGLASGWLLMRLDRRNFRDTAGFRPEMHRQLTRDVMRGYPLLVVIIIMASYLVMAWLGISGQRIAAAGVTLVLTLISARSMNIFCRNPFQIGMFAYCVVIAVGLSALALGWIPPSLSALPLLAATLLFFTIFHKRPTRMDYSLFLRAAHRQSKFSAITADPAAGRPFERGELLKFARFLGSLFLVTNFRWESNGLALRLPPIASRFLTNIASVFLPPISQHCSILFLAWNGTVSAHCGRTDAKTLSAQKTIRLTDPHELEKMVAAWAGEAWREFRLGDPAAAGRTLGEVPEAEVFLRPPNGVKSLLGQRIAIGVAVVLMVPALVQPFWQPAWLSGQHPVSVSEAQVRAFLNDSTRGSEPDFSKFNSPTKALFWPYYFVLPGTNMYSPAGLQAMRDELARACGFASWKQSQWTVQGCDNIPTVRLAVAAGWLDWADLGRQPREISEYLHKNQSANEGLFKTEHLLTNERAWSWVDHQAWEVKRVGYFTLTQLRWLQSVNCLDLVDRDNLIRQIVSVQDLSATPSAGQPKLHDWRDVRGLFFTPCYPALQDTCVALAALEILGGLDQIDREACVQGILRRHQGRGFFTSPNSGSFNEYHIDGSAADTIAAFESLRILGALDRVKDLDRWRFRVARRNTSATNAKGVRKLTWDEVQAWVGQQRLEKILAERRTHPGMPFGSLMNP